MGLIALLALGGTAVHANQSETRLTSTKNSVLAERSNAYFTCLQTQARSLIGVHDVVDLADPTLSEWVTVTKVLGGWANLTLRRDTATVSVLVQPSSSPGTCNGDVLVTIRRGPDGHVVMARGLQGSA